MRLWEKTRTNEKLLITEVYLKHRLQQNLEDQKRIVQRATSDRPRSVIVLSVTVDLLLDLFDAEASPACNATNLHETNELYASMPPTNASTGRLLRIQIDLIRPQHDKSHDFGWSKSLEERPANG